MARAIDPVLTAAQMRAAEQALVDVGIGVNQLMQRAGRGAAEWVWRVAAGRAVTVLCGPGNNGGDGYVVAETLRERGLPVTVIAPIEPKTDAARGARAAWRGDVTAGGAGARGAVLVDCLFGSGLSRPLSGELADLLSGLAQRHDATVAVDLPSGVETDSGALLGPAPRCRLTLALGAWKPAHFLMPAMAGMGGLELVDIGVAAPPGCAELYPRPELSAPAADAHKYRRGLLAVFGGAMPGAALLAAEAAMRAGAGYVKLLADRANLAAPADLVVDDRSLSAALEDDRIDALLVGPGLGRDAAARDRLRTVLARDAPTVLDADALVLLEPGLLRGRGAPVLVTPHEGELARLCAAFGIDAEGKRERAERLAAKAGVTVLAKGPDTILCSPDRTAFFVASPSWLSIAGTGDVLAGIAASRLATGNDPYTAAGDAVWLHREAARRAGPAFTAGDLARSVSVAVAALL